MDEFLTAVYPHYDLAIWSQTHWKYIEIKITQLGIATNPNFKICFILDKTYMFNVSADKTISNKVKPLQLIWAKHPNLWSSCNTLHVDDIEKNFLLNKSSGILISPYNRAPLPQGTNPSSAQAPSSSAASAIANQCDAVRSNQCSIGCGTTSIWKGAPSPAPAPAPAPSPLPSSSSSLSSPSPPSPPGIVNNPVRPNASGVIDRELDVLSRFELNQFLSCPITCTQP